MIRLFNKFAHWMFHHPGHHHIYQYVALRNEDGEVRFFWRCTFLLCGEEIEDDTE